MTATGKEYRQFLAETYPEKPQAFISEIDWNVRRYTMKRTAAAWRKKAPKAKRRNISTGYSAPLYKSIKSRKAPPGAELKVHQIGQNGTILSTDSSTTVPTYSQVGSLNLISQGDGQGNRQGIRLTLKEIHINGEVGMDNNSSVDWTDLVKGDAFFRIIVYIDHQCNGAAASVTDFFDTGPVSEYAFGVFNNLVETGRYTVLKDKRVKVSAIAPVFGDDPGSTNFWHQAASVTRYQMHCKNLDVRINYGDGSANLAAVRTNNVGMFILCSKALKDQMFHEYRARIRFYDY